MFVSSIVYGVSLHDVLDLPGCPPREHFPTEMHVFIPNIFAYNVVPGIGYELFKTRLKRVTSQPLCCLRGQGFPRVESISRKTKFGGMCTSYVTNRPLPCFCPLVLLTRHRDCAIWKSTQAQIGRMNNQRSWRKHPLMNTGQLTPLSRRQVHTGNKLCPPDILSKDRS